VWIVIGFDACNASGFSSTGKKVYLRLKQQLIELIIVKQKKHQPGTFDYWQLHPA